MLKTFIALALAGGSFAVVHAQAIPTATRRLDIQVGGEYVNANSDYSRSRDNGYGIYADADFWHGLGAEAEFHFVSDEDPNTNVYERTYEIGARYSRHYGRFQPYAKLMVGRGVFNYQANFSNLAYNLGALGAGTDVHITRHINARFDYEYQHWFSFSRNGDPSLRNDSLTPDMLSGGVAYHF
jgi:opacity protein-like surface antigen